jgi:predicted RNA-binding Zn ribbon-like protein
MSERSLIDLVVQTREAQRKYFRTRSSGDLETSKALEKRLDAALRDYLSGPTLFDGAGREGAAS